MHKNFMIGDEVVLIADFDDILYAGGSLGMEGKLVAIDESGYLVDFGNDFTWYFWGDIDKYIQLLTDPVPYRKIIFKIKEIRERRKSLGYAW